MNVVYLGMRDLDSSAASGQRLAKAASSNLCSFFCISKLEWKRNCIKNRIAIRKQKGGRHLRMAAMVSRFLNLLNLCV